MTVKKDLKHDYYKNTLFDESSRVSFMTSLRSHETRVKTLKTRDYLLSMIRDILSMPSGVTLMATIKSLETRIVIVNTNIWL